MPLSGAAGNQSTNEITVLCSHAMRLIGLLLGEIHLGRLIDQQEARHGSIALGAIPMQREQRRKLDRQGRTGLTIF